MLTGESVPVAKNSIMLVKEIYDPSDSDSSKKHTLFSGTKVIQAKKMGTIPNEVSCGETLKGTEV